MGSLRLALIKFYVGSGCVGDDMSFRIVLNANSPLPGASLSLPVDLSLAINFLLTVDFFFSDCFDWSALRLFSLSSIHLRKRCTDTSAINKESRKRTSENKREFKKPLKSSHLIHWYYLKESKNEWDVVKMPESQKWPINMTIQKTKTYIQTKNHRLSSLAQQREKSTLLSMPVKWSRKQSINENNANHRTLKSSDLNKWVYCLCQLSIGIALYSLLYFKLKTQREMIIYKVQNQNHDGRIR